MLKRFLIVDDDTKFTDLVAHKLKDDAQCSVAHTGKDALLLFEHHLREKAPFHAVVMDIGLPDIDGHETVKHMRLAEKESKVPPAQAFKLIMLTAHDDIKNVSRSFFQGAADAYVPKKIFEKSFMKELEKNQLL